MKKLSSLALVLMLALAVTPALAAPTAPMSLVATPVSPTQINLSWASSTDATVVGYTVYRNAVQIATTSASALGFNDLGLQPLTLYSYIVRTFDASSTQSADATVATTTLADTLAPSVPTGLSATPFSPTQINLAWASSTDNVAVAGYQVFRNGVQVATTTVPSYNNTGLTASTSYNYTIATFDASNNFSLQSSPAVVGTTPGTDTQTPSVPTNLAATPVSSSQINLLWSAATDNVAVAGYKVFRGGSQIATTTVNNFSDTALAASTTYSYTVDAIDSSGNASGQSNVATATTLAATSTPPIATTTANIKVVGNEGAGRVINLRSNAKIKVIVYGDANLDVKTIDPKTVTFAGAKAKDHWKMRYNRDRFTDRVFEFRAREMVDLFNASSTATSTNRIISVEAIFKATAAGKQLEFKTTVRVKNLKAWKNDEARRRAEAKRKQELKERKAKEAAERKARLEREAAERKAKQEKLRQAAASAKQSIKQIQTQAKQQVSAVKQQLKEVKNQVKQIGKNGKKDD